MLLLVETTLCPVLCSLETSVVWARVSTLTIGVAPNEFNYIFLVIFVYSTSVD